MNCREAGCEMPDRSRRHVRAIQVGLCAIVWSVSLVGSDSVLRAEASIDGVEAGRTSLQERRDLPWYDPATDSVRPVELKPKSPPPEVVGRSWRIKERKPAAAKRGPSFGGLLRLVEIFAWIAVAAILLGLIYMFVRRILDNEQDELRSMTFETDEEIEEGKIEHLPFQVAATWLQTPGGTAPPE